MASDSLRVMDLWNSQDFWSELAPPALAASFVLTMLGIAARWAWTQGKNVVLYGVLWLMTAVFLVVMFTAFRPSMPIEVIVDGNQPSRPYFTQTQAAIQDVSQGIRTLTVSVQNNGNPARDVVSQLLALGESLDPTIEPLHTNRIESANDVGPGGTLSQHWFVDIKQNARPAFIVFEIRYTDAIEDETHSQVLFLKFLGSSQDGSFIQQLFTASSDEKVRNGILSKRSRNSKIIRRLGSYIPNDCLPPVAAVSLGIDTDSYGCCT